jgi:hypothetical protein
MCVRHRVDRTAGDQRADLVGHLRRRRTAVDEGQTHLLAQHAGLGVDLLGRQLSWAQHSQDGPKIPAGPCNGTTMATFRVSASPGRTREPGERACTSMRAIVAKACYRNISLDGVSGMASTVLAPVRSAHTLTTRLTAGQ